MSQFLSGGGVDCGPSTVLKQVGGRLERDFSLHQDRFIPSIPIAGPSRTVSRPSPDDSRLQHSNHPPGPLTNPFDFASFEKHLPSAPQVQTPFKSADWAASFVPPQASSRARGKQRAVVSEQSRWQADFLHHENRATHPATFVTERFQPGIAPWQRPFSQPQVFYPPQVDIPHYFTPPPLPISAPPPQVLTPLPPRSATAPPETSTSSEPLTASQELLARTAEALVTDLNSSNGVLEANPKLAQSQFMSLMKSLSDRTVVVDEGAPVTGTDEIGEGAKFVERANGALDWAGDFLNGPSATSSLTLPGMTAPPVMTSAPQIPVQHDSGIPQPIWAEQFQHQDPATDSIQRPAPARRKSVHFEDSHTEMGQTLDNLDIDEEAFMTFNGPMRQAHNNRIGVGDLESWGSLQKDWEEVMGSGSSTSRLRGMGNGDQVERYLFQRSNPFAGGVEGMDRELASPTLRGVLELEAAVQRDPTNHEAWYALGLKQQENEREDQAILALAKTVQLEPEYRQAYLALAVSYTNEGSFEAANTMLEKWIDLGEGSEVKEFAGGAGWAEGQKRLVERLIDLARKSPEEVDADVQIALGVLFNSTEEYHKAEDCFLAALSVRPNDWLLYNRLGATLANSGRSNEAISYYHKALSLHPHFVRALFNLGISYINLAQYSSAAQHILDALRLQHADATEAYPIGEGVSTKGVTSEALWHSLRNACVHMGRTDLVALANHRDLSGFPLNIEQSNESQVQ